MILLPLPPECCSNMLAPCFNFKRRSCCVVYVSFKLGVPCLGLLSTGTTGMHMTYMATGSVFVPLLPSLVNRPHNPDWARLLLYILTTVTVLQS